MQYTVEITIPEAREDVFMAIFDALVATPGSVAAVGDMKTTGAPSHVVIAVDAADAHAATSEAVRLFRDAVVKSGVERTARTTITALHAERMIAENLPHPNELAPV